MQSLKESFITVDLSSRGMRRNILPLVISLLDRIRIAEETYALCLGRFLDAYNFTEYSIDRLYNAIDVIRSVYDENQYRNEG